MRKQHSMGYTSQQKNDRGFYIILAVCLVVIVVSGYVLFFAPGAAQTGGMDETVYTPTDTELTDGTAAVVLPDVDVPVQPVGEPEAQRKPETEPPEESETGAASASDVPAAAPVEPVEPAFWSRSLSRSLSFLPKNPNMGVPPWSSVIGLILSAIPDRSAPW